MGRRRLGTFAVVAMALALCFVGSACALRPYNDGTYAGISEDDFHGYAVAQVRIEKGKIAEVALSEFTELGLPLDFDDYPRPQTLEAKQTIEKALVGRRDNKVDAVTQATRSSEKYIQAVGFALEKARKTPTVKTTYFDGTFQGHSAQEDDGWGLAWVTVKGDKITAVKVEEVSSEGKLRDWATYEYPKALVAKGEMPSRFISANSPAVDMVTGATLSSARWIEAVSSALEAAKIR